MTDKELKNKLNMFGIVIKDSNSNFIGYAKIYEKLVFLLTNNRYETRIKKELMNLLWEVDNRNIELSYCQINPNSVMAMDNLVSKAQQEMDQKIMNDAYKALLASSLSLNYMLGDKKVRNITKDIKKVIHSDPATIVYWNDNSKTVVKVQNGEPYDKEKGLAMCIIKKICDNKGNFNEVFKKWCE